MYSTTLQGFEDKVVLISGAGRGQGANHARALAEAGCDIVALDTTTPIPDLYRVADRDDLDRTVKEVEARGRRALPVVADVRDEQQVKAAVQEALDTFGKIDVLINNAGMAAIDPIHEMRSHVLDAVIDINLKGPMWLAKYVVPNMIGRRTGKIINISSAVIGSGHAMLSHYVASKHGVVGLTRSWATELSEFGIAVNGIAPATIKPDPDGGSYMVIGLAEALGGISMAESYEHFSGLVNFEGWRAEMDDITNAVLYLVSDNARVVTGHMLHVDCGQATR
ncbi:SDR family NAD(P)-dependent oxidoreductase [Actinomycetospora straminea]|uniref:Mycofactocin-coupled SDR family oxidoreductase n=1 Tax=Actinomycetospora straminea TaxID=663607 RepID=A0ABP9EJY3_9PSEU|nr:SDR family NAD(P)-dependent oxidoreductase [Actinomycetospora straminea]MDD7933791.1 SDR family NAD(P)-dependent oxidoreductase [Actinomycetospora straminea]